ncbi:hypothetical protein NDU88_006987 [Pleurodeles waltl]|uniref:Uncharacterized protein n=1 Tax=Pleurodeles waltl TaxID=8319 RepID=A0AAV7SR47_PLEWA|nr:hypothetical protein NDU88_006987 [Pleurodeles waltl]
MMQRQSMLQSLQDPRPNPGPADPAAAQELDTEGKQTSRDWPDVPKSGPRASPQDKNGAPRSVKSSLCLRKLRITLKVTEWAGENGM